MVTVKAHHLRRGDVIEWCGRPTTIIDIRPPRRIIKRGGRLFDVDVEGHGRLEGLHYYDDEPVTLLADGPWPPLLAPMKTTPEIEEAARPVTVHPVTRAYRKALDRQAAAVPTGNEQ